MSAQRRFAQCLFVVSIINFSIMQQTRGMLNITIWFFLFNL